MDANKKIQTLECVKAELEQLRDNVSATDEFVIVCDILSSVEKLSVILDRPRNSKGLQNEV